MKKRIAAVTVLLLLIEMVREFCSFRMSYYKISSAKMRGMKGRGRIVFLSDLHNHVYKRANEPLFNAVKEECPDLILIGGDMLIGKKGKDFSAALDFVKKLAAVCPVYYANGNHEQRLKEKPEYYGDVYENYKAELLKAGVHFLENESENVILCGQTVRVTGLEIPGEYYTRFVKRALKVEEIRSCIPCREKECYQILLSHNPIYMEQYFAWGADLVLSGHLHGGIVRIPFLGGVISPGFTLFPKYSGGYFRKGDKCAVVSRGLGSHTIPVRLFNPAEAVVLEFQGCETEESLV